MSSKTKVVIAIYNSICHYSRNYRAAWKNLQAVCHLVIHKSFSASDSMNLLHLSGHVQDLELTFF